MRRSGLAVGVLLASTVIALHARADVVVTVERATYYVGEIVHFAITNNGDETAVFFSIPPWCVVNLDPQVQYPPCVTLPGFSFLDPGLTVEGTWDTGVYPDPPGNYAVVAGSAWGYYMLESPTPVTAASWSALKAAYR